MVQLSGVRRQWCRGWARGQNEDGGGYWITAGDGWALDVIGPVVTTPGQYDDEGEEIAPPVIDGRFHANLRTVSQEIADSVPAGVVVTPEPGTPVRVWA